MVDSSVQCPLVPFLAQIRTLPSALQLAKRGYGSFAALGAANDAREGKRRRSQMASVWPTNVCTLVAGSYGPYGSREGSGKIQILIDESREAEKTNLRGEEMSTEVTGAVWPRYVAIGSTSDGGLSMSTSFLQIGMWKAVDLL